MMRTFSIHRQMILRVAALALLLLASSGCEEKVYRIEQWPRGDKLWRRLTFSRRDKQEGGDTRSLSDADKAEAAQIARVYGNGKPKFDHQNAKFVGAFASALPRDVGGDGHYVHWDSPLGSVSIYVERFRGSDDPAATLEARRKGVDQLVDIIVGWFESQLRDEPDWPALRKFLDTTFRHDLQNLSIYGWLAHIRPDSTSKNEYVDLAFRVTQYFVERHYVSYEEAPELFRVLHDLNLGGGAGSLGLIQRILLARVGAAPQGRLSHALGFLSDAQVAWFSWERYLRKTGFYKREWQQYVRLKRIEFLEEQGFLAKNAPGLSSALRKVVADAAHASDDALATAVRELGKLDAKPLRIDNDDFERTLSLKFLDPFFKIRLENSSRVEVSLEVPREPFWTNGKWLPKERRVEWSQRIAELTDPADGPAVEWPALCVAVWDEPNEPTQKQILGKAVLTSQHLFQYCLWYQGLSAWQKEEWDDFLPTANRDAQLAARLKAFRFSDEPAKREAVQLVATPAVNELIEALDPPAHRGPKLKIEPLPAPPPEARPRQTDPAAPKLPRR